MTKADIVDGIASATGFTKTDTSEMVERFLAVVSEALSQKEHIEIRGFGTFKVVRSAPRVGRNPKTGETVRIPERYTPVFKPAQALKDRIREPRNV